MSCEIFSLNLMYVCMYVCMYICAITLVKSHRRASSIYVDYASFIAWLHLTSNSVLFLHWYCLGLITATHRWLDNLPPPLHHCNECSMRLRATSLIFVYVMTMHQCSSLHQRIEYQLSDLTFDIPRTCTIFKMADLSHL